MEALRAIKVAILDDDADMRELLRIYLEREGIVSEVFESGKTLIEALQAQDPKLADLDAILSDIMMPEMDGLTFVTRLKEVRPNLPVILVTAHGSLETAIQAMRNGASDYLIKPVKSTELRLAIEFALRTQRLEEDNEALRREIKKNWGFHGMVGKSPDMLQIFELLQRISKTTANILITGESGTGKELVARAIHDLGPRKDKPFVAINCSAIPATLLESELFGHSRGSFTGATQARKGLFEEASEGTLFLDEIGDMELSLQAKLLRAIQERAIKPVGENKYRKIDVQIVFATHRDLLAEIKKGTFREDLYYRIAVIPINLPALRQRKEDIPILAEYFLQKYSAAHSGKANRFSPGAIHKLISYPWPGNVRELENAVERASILSKQNEVLASDIPLFLETEANSESTMLEDLSLQKLCLKDIEKRYIELILHKSHRKEEAARILGIDRKTLYRKQREYGLNLGS